MKVTVCDFCDKELKTDSGDAHELRMFVDDERHYGDLDLCTRCLTSFTSYINNCKTVRREG